MGARWHQQRRKPSSKSLGETRGFFFCFRGCIIAHKPAHKNKKKTKKQALNALKRQEMSKEKPQNDTKTRKNTFHVPPLISILIAKSRINKRFSKRLPTFCPHFTHRVQNSQSLLLLRGVEVAVHIPRHLDRGMTEAARDFFDVHAIINQECCVRMPEIVDGNLRDTGKSGGLALRFKQFRIMDYIVTAADAPVFGEPGHFSLLCLPAFQILGQHGGNADVPN